MGFGFRYISVGDSELFYYFIESQGNPQEDPLFLWLTGGPGCSSFNGLIYEIGTSLILHVLVLLYMGQNVKHDFFETDFPTRSEIANPS